MHLHDNPNSLLTMQRGHTQMKMSDLCSNKKKSAESFQIYLSEITQMQMWLPLQYNYQENPVYPFRRDLQIPVSKIPRNWNQI